MEKTEDLFLEGIIGVRFAIDFEFCPLYFSFLLLAEVTELKTNNGFDVNY